MKESPVNDPQAITPTASEPTVWHLYLVRCADGSLYTGITTDVPRRLDQHRNNRGARRLKGQGPLQLAFAEAVGDRVTALKLEYRVKRLSKTEKEALVAGARSLPELP